MVRTFFPENLNTLKEITSIYKKLAYRILSELPSHKVTCCYKGKTQELDTPEQIQNFLMARDFYEYDFKNYGSFFSDFFNLRGNCLLRNIISGKSKSKAIEKFSNKYPDDSFSGEYKKLEAYKNLTVSQFAEKCKFDPDIEAVLAVQKAFSYEHLSKEDRHTILVAMDVPVCPYCNMNYTIAYEMDGEQRSTADVDHFYLKSEYLFYSLCLYNFVPACQVCNSRFKGQRSMKKETHIFPNEDSFSRKARFKIKNMLEIVLKPDTRAIIGLNNYASDPRVDASSELFMIESRYDAVHGFAEELVEKKNIYSDLYLKELEEGLPGILRSITEKQLVFGKVETEERYARRSLGKLRMDLLKQLKVYPDD